MLPKKVYSQVLQKLRHIKTQWDEDRIENPKRVPYEIDSQLRHLIDACITEGHVHCHGNKNREILIDQTVNYMVEKGILIGSPYGGVMFPLPVDAPPLPSEEELIAEIHRQLESQSWF